MLMDGYREQIVKGIDHLSPELIRVAEFIGKNPEQAFQEFKAQEKLVNFLKKKGFQVKKGVGGVKTSFLATIKGKKRAPHIGFLAEYDALPGIGHACGHNLIGTASCAAAIALSLIAKEFGTISVIGCPAEEGGGGKIVLAKKGVFKPLSVAMMVHPDMRTTVIKKMLALVEIDIRFLGRSSHAAAAPEKGINALDAAVLTYAKILEYRKTLSSSARVHGIFTAAGQKPNIIPDDAGLKYYIRSLEMKEVRKIIKKIKAIANGVAKKIGAKVIFYQNPMMYEAFHPNRALAAVFNKQLKFLGIKEKRESETKGIGSSDVGNVGKCIPTIHPSIQISHNALPHSSDFTQVSLSKAGYQGMIVAAKALALTGLEVLLNPGILKEIQKEHEQRKI